MQESKVYLVFAISFFQFSFNKILENVLEKVSIRHAPHEPINTIKLLITKGERCSFC